MFSRLSVLCVLLMATIPVIAQLPQIEPGVSLDLAKWRASNYSDVRYKLNITLEKGAPLMKGTIEIRVNLTDAGAGNDLILDWRTTQFENDKDKPFASVVAVNNMSAEPEKASTDLNASDSNADFRADALTAGGTPALQSALQSVHSNDHLIVPQKFLKTGENVIKIEFASPIKSSGAAFTRYVDKEDGAEYVYSLFVPSDASTAFPVFDQPDLKARFQLMVDIAGRDRPDWKVISNTNGKSGFESTWQTRWTFEETKPISTYVFAIAAGDFAEVIDPFVQTCVSTRGRMSEPPAVAGGLTRQSTNSNTNKSDSKKIPNGNIQPPATAGGSDLPMKIFVRRSQAGKFKQHAAEVFRLNREGIRFLEHWFDHKFPFPKYDLVLIPEFPFGGMEHAGATFLREDRVIFPTEPTKNDYITRANVIFHEAAHQWFGDTVTMKWFDDLWLKEGFAEFMAYKTLENVTPEYNAWKVFYERNKQAAYLTDVTRGTTPIYQEIANLSSAKSAYGNIVYRKAPSFLRQAEFYLGEDKFQTAVRAFLKKHEFTNAEWTDLVNEFETAGNQDLTDWANIWVKKRGLPVFKMEVENPTKFGELTGVPAKIRLRFSQSDVLHSNTIWQQKLQFFYIYENGKTRSEMITLGKNDKEIEEIWGINFLGRDTKQSRENLKPPKFIFTNYLDFGYGIFLLDEKSRAYVLENIQTEKDEFLRSMMWGSLWDSVRFYELDPREYVELVIKNLSSELRLEPRKTSAANGVEENENSLTAAITPEGVTLNEGVTLYDESTIQLLLNRVSTAMTYYLSEPPAAADGLILQTEANEKDQKDSYSTLKPSATADGSDLAARVERLLKDRMQTSPTLGQRITFYRSFVSVAATGNGRQVLKDILNSKLQIPDLKLKTKDKFDIVTRLIVLGDADGLKLLAALEKTETDDAAKRYAYAARAGVPTAENKAKYWKDFTENKEVPESWIEAAFAVWNSPRHSGLTLPYLEKALAEVPNLKRNRKIFFVNGWLSSFIGGQKSAEALEIVNKFLDDNPNLDNDLRLKILENADGLERAVKIRAKFGE